MQKHEFKDRGNIKWTAMMLPEHRVALQDWEVSQEDIDPPDHDEYDLAELAGKLATAMQDGELVTVRYWKNKRYHDINGVVKKIDPLKRAVLVDASTVDEWDQRWIHAEHIFEVE